MLEHGFRRSTGARALDPAIAQRFVGEIVHVPEDQRPGHKPRRQWWLTRPDRPNRPARNPQSISAARRTSGWRRLMISSERDQTHRHDDRRAARSRLFSGSESTIKRITKTKMRIPKPQETEISPHPPAKPNTLIRALHTGKSRSFQILLGRPNNSGHEPEWSQGSHYV